MSDKLKLLFLLSVFLLIQPSFLFSVSSEFFEAKTTQDFEKGEFKNISMQNDGKLLLSPEYSEKVDLDEPYIWSLVSNGNGEIFAGTGDEGKVFKIDIKGNKALFYDADDLEVLSILVDKKDNLYIGTGPEGNLYKVDDKGKLLFKKDVEASYVWNIVMNSKGDIYLGTGNEGKIYTVSSSGDISLFVDLPEDNVTALIFDEKDNLYAGTNPGGLIYSISTDKTVKVLYDTSYEEIRKFAIDSNGNIYAAANSAKRALMIAAPPMMKQEQPKGESQSGEMPDKMVEMPAEESQMMFQDMGGGEPPSKVESTVYKLTPDGLVTKVWVNKNLMIYSMELDEQSLPIIGTGSDGLIFRIIEEDKDIALIKIDDSEILSLLKLKDGFLFCTGNDGKVYEFKGSLAKSGTYTSKVFDTKTPMSKFGMIQADAVIQDGSAIKIAYRIGESEKPDDLWSPWSEGFDAGSPFKVDKEARFIQIKADLTTKDQKSTPLLNSFKISYIQKNYPPKIIEIKIDSDSSKSKEAKEQGVPNPNFTFPEGMEPPVKGDGEDEGPKFERDNMKSSAKKWKTKIRWNAKDPNNDSLTYELYFKGEAEDHWKLLEKEITSTTKEIDNSSLPDGKYRIKLQASDQRNNGEGRGLKSEKVSESFKIDNTPPAIEVSKPEGKKGKEHHEYTIKVRITDLSNTIAQVRYSSNASEWKYLPPDDGLYDSKDETATCILSDLKSEDGKEITIMIKAIDQAGNVGAAGVTVYL